MYIYKKVYIVISHSVNNIKKEYKIVHMLYQLFTTHRDEKGKIQRNNYYFNSYNYFLLGKKMYG